MEKGVCGVLEAWTIPRRDQEGFTSVVLLRWDDGTAFSLAVTLPSAEDHVWRTGQEVAAREVFFDSPLRGRTYENVTVPEEKERAFPCFLNFPVNKVASLVREESGALMVRFVDGMVVTCVDLERAKEVVEIGIGCLVQLFNVKSTRRGLFVTAKSGVKRWIAVEPPPPPLSPPRPCEPPRPLYKWQCIVCAHVNYPSKSVCYGCGYTRKEGPMYKDARFCLRK
jgi:hypothetical protein